MRRVPHRGAPGGPGSCARCCSASAWQSSALGDPDLLHAGRGVRAVARALQHAPSRSGRCTRRRAAQHLLGLDDGGIDMLSEVIAGARVSMLVGFSAAAVAMLIGGGVGLLSGYFGGKTDIVLMRITDYFLVIPDVPLMIVAAAVFGRSLLNIIIIIGVIYWTSTARLIRAQVKSVRERVYVKRARALGGGHRRLLWKHITPQVAPLLVANTVLTIAIAVFAETYIAFLGLGDPSTISWGRLIQNSLTGGADLPQGVVGDHPARAVRHDRDPGRHDDGPGDGGRAQPAAAGRPPVGAPLPAAAAAREARLRVSAATPVLQRRGSARLVRRRPAASCTPCRASTSTCARASGWGSWASRAAARRRRSSRSWGCCRRARASPAGCCSTARTCWRRARRPLRPHRWRDVAMVFQGAMNAFNPVKTVGSQIVEPMELHGIASGRAARSAGGASCSSWSGSPGRAPTATRTSSRAACASGRRSRWRSPATRKVLLADEPTTALDVMVQAQILELLVRLTEDLGLAMILVTHDLPVVAQVCGRAAVMYAGKVAESGPMDDALPRSSPSRTRACSSRRRPTCTATTG